MGNLIVRTPKKNVTSLVEFQLFRMFLTNHKVLVYAFENLTQNALDYENGKLL